MKPFSDFLDTVDDSDYSDYIEKIVEHVNTTEPTHDNAMLSECFYKLNTDLLLPLVCLLPTPHNLNYHILLQTSPYHLANHLTWHLFPNYDIWGTEISPLPLQLESHNSDSYPL